MPQKGTMLSKLQSSAPITIILFCRPSRISSKAIPSACPDEAQAETNPVEDPRIPKCGN